MTACFPPFWFTQNTFLEHHATTRQQATILRENSFLKDQLFLFFLEHTQDFLGRSQWRNQGEGANGASTLFSHVI